MSLIIEYAEVLEEMERMGLHCLYHNSGAFGFGKGLATHSVGWVGGEDGSIRAEALAITRKIEGPVEERLADLAVKVWKEIFPGRAWIMPRSHWAYELDFGSAGWMAELLESIGVESKMLLKLNNAAAVEFGEPEVLQFTGFVRLLLENLRGSDFTLVFPGWPIVCTVHSHRQLWWTGLDAGLIERVDGVRGKLAGGV